MNVRLNFRCEDTDAKAANERLIGRLRDVVGRKHVITDPSSTHRYRKGFRFGDGPALAVVRPGSLVEMWRSLKLCASAGKIVIMQAANTGITGGSTPDGDTYDRDIVIISGMRLDIIHPIKNGEQVVCLPGATLYELERLLKPLRREPHSVIGSSCIGASIFGGICNNSGGALIHRGPAFTQTALYARISGNGQVELVNHLGIKVEGDEESVLARVQAGDFASGTIVDDPDRHSSDHDYQNHVRHIEAETPARFNADAGRLFEASGSAGKIMLMAVRLDTFPMEKRTSTFYIGSNDPDELTKIRRHILSKFEHLPIKGEYIHREAFSIAEKYGKDTYLAIQYLGTARLPLMFALKGRFDALCAHFKVMPHDLSDRVMQAIANLFPKHLPKRLYEYHARFEHHLLLEMGGDGIEEAHDYLRSMFPSTQGDFFECVGDEGGKAFLHRFAVAGAANRYRAMHRPDVAGLLALDIALPRNELHWVERLPEELSSRLEVKMYYGHFFCQVFHQDYIVEKGFDISSTEGSMWKILDARGAEYPAEHNVGHLYYAKPTLVEHYRSLDPSNSFNPGIGHTSKCACWQ